MTNQQFAARTGYHYTTVSRLRNGQRRPSLGQLMVIVDHFDQIGLEEALKAHQEGPAAFGQLLRERVLEVEEPEGNEDSG